LNLKIPEIYLAYLNSEKPKEGFLTSDPGYFQLWPFQDIVEMNQKYKISEFTENYIAFGSNGGDEMFAFDENGNISMIPFIGMSSVNAIKIAKSWDDFEKLIEE
jgi:hypothetical protein